MIKVCYYYYQYNSGVATNICLTLYYVLVLKVFLKSIFGMRKTWLSLCYQYYSDTTPC